MKHTAHVLLLALSAFAVQASDTVATTGSATTATKVDTVKPAAEKEIVISASAADTVVVRDTGCVRDSGTHLARRDKNGCTGAPGQSISRTEIDRSGATDTADAIRKLSPSATVRRGN